MKIGKAVRPYKSAVTRDGTRTNFSIQEKNFDQATKQWSGGQWYTLSVENMNFPIEAKNPQGYKIVPNNLTGITFGEYNGNLTITIWCDDVDIQDKEGNVIVQGSKKTAKAVGTNAREVQAQIPTGFKPADDEEIPF